MRFPFFIMLLLILAGCNPGDNSSALDDDTEAWWKTTTELSNDEMEGRDTGSPGYARAATIVAERLEAKPSLVFFTNELFKYKAITY